MGQSSIRNALFALAACLPAVAFAADPLPGIFAMPDGPAKVTATLAITPGRDGAMTMDVAMTKLGQSRPVARYDTELSKQLHLIAVGSDFRTFVHEHGEHPDARGHFEIAMRFPHAGLYHVYADGVPAGLGQQVMRFEVTVGDAPPAPAATPPAVTALEAEDGAYAVRFDPFQLRAGQEREVDLHLTRNGNPAPDVTPFLGVAAHAVFIDSADLSYVHVHAAPTETPAAGGPGAPTPHDMTAMPAPKPNRPAMAGMSGMEGMGPPLRAGSRVPADLTLHVLAPKAGTYLLWIQFMGGGQVRTVPFVVAVT